MNDFLNKLLQVIRKLLTDNPDTQLSEFLASITIRDNKTVLDASKLNTSLEYAPEQNIINQSQNAIQASQHTQAKKTENKKSDIVDLNKPEIEKTILENSIILAMLPIPFVDLIPLVYKQADTLLQAAQAKLDLSKNQKEANKNPQKQNQETQNLIEDDKKKQDAVQPQLPILDPMRWKALFAAYMTFSMKHGDQLVVSLHDSNLKRFKDKIPGLLLYNYDNFIEFTGKALKTIEEETILCQLLCKVDAALNPVKTELQKQKQEQLPMAISNGQTTDAIKNASSEKTVPITQSNQKILAESLSSSDNPISQATELQKQEQLTIKNQKANKEDNTEELKDIDLGDPQDQAILKKSLSNNQTQESKILSVPTEKKTPAQYIGLEQIAIEKFQAIEKIHPFYELLSYLDNQTNLDLSKKYRSFLPIIGTMLGDSIGLQKEFYRYITNEVPNEKNITFKRMAATHCVNDSGYGMHPADHTDDTAQCLALLEALQSQNKNQNQNQISEEKFSTAFYYQLCLWYYNRAYTGGLPKTIGVGHLIDHNMGSIIRTLNDTYEKHGLKSSQSANISLREELQATNLNVHNCTDSSKEGRNDGNGYIMRLAAILPFANSRKHAIELAYNQAKVTTIGNPLMGCLMGAVCYQGLQGESWENVSKIENLLEIKNSIMDFLREKACNTNTRYDIFLPSLPQDLNVLDKIIYQKPPYKWGDSTPNPPYNPITYNNSPRYYGAYAPDSIALAFWYMEQRVKNNDHGEQHNKFAQFLSRCGDADSYGAITGAIYRSFYPEFSNDEINFIKILLENKMHGVNDQNYITIGAFLQNTATGLALNNKKMQAANTETSQTHRVTNSQDHNVQDPNVSCFDSQSNSPVQPPTKDASYVKASINLKSTITSTEQPSKITKVDILNNCLATQVIRNEIDNNEFAWLKNLDNRELKSVCTKIHTQLMRLINRYDKYDPTDYKLAYTSNKTHTQQTAQQTKEEKTKIERYLLKYTKCNESEAFKIKTLYDLLMKAKRNDLHVLFGKINELVDERKEHCAKLNKLYKTWLPSCIAESRLRYNTTTLNLIYELRNVVEKNITKPQQITSYDRGHQL